MMIDSKQYPYYFEKIPVAQGVHSFRSFIERFPGFTFCPYIASKDSVGWTQSTSRVYMNQVLPYFLYVPVEISKGDAEELNDFLSFAQSDQSINAVNITQPHKSHSVLFRLFAPHTDGPRNIDTLIRNNGLLVPCDLNSAAFVEWFKVDVSPFQHREVIVVGVGGVGEPIAKRIAEEGPKSLLLIDPNDKSELVGQLSSPSIDVAYAQSLVAATRDGVAPGTILINAAGKEGAENESELWRVVRAGAESGIFVDIRPQLDIDIVELAASKGWSAHTGHGMNARNDYVLLQGIAMQVPGAMVPTFSDFQALVANASHAKIRAGDQLRQQQE